MQNGMWEMQEKTDNIQELSLSYILTQDVFNFAHVINPKCNK